MKTCVTSDVAQHCAREICVKFVDLKAGLLGRKVDRWAGGLADWQVYRWAGGLVEGLVDRWAGWLAD